MTTPPLRSEETLWSNFAEEEKQITTGVKLFHRAICFSLKQTTPEARLGRPTSFSVTAKEQKTNKKKNNGPKFGHKQKRTKKNRRRPFSNHASKQPEEATLEEGLSWLRRRLSILNGNHSIVNHCTVSTAPEGFIPHLSVFNTSADSV